MELRHLRYFAAVAEELNFGRAAKKLHIAQPPLSQQIQNLEEELGTQLFDRSKRPITLTPAGQAFRIRARTILESAQAAAKEVNRIGAGKIGSLGIGYMSTLTLSHLPSILRHFQAECPDVDITLSQKTSTEQMEDVAAGRCDIGFVSIRPPEHSLIVDGVNLVCLPAWHEVLGAAMSVTHPLAHREVLDVADLAEETFIGLPRSPYFGYFDLVIELCTKAGFSPRISHNMPQLQSALALIAANYGVGLMPLSLAKAWESDVVFLPLRERPEISVNAIIRADDASPVLTAFLDALQRVVASGGED